MNLVYCFSNLDTKGNLLGILNILCILGTLLNFGSTILNQNSAHNIISRLK